MNNLKTELRSTPVVVSKGTNRMNGIGGTVAVAIFASMLWSDHFFWAIVVILVGGGISLWMIITGQGDSEADCPTCMKRFILRLDFEAKFRRCPWCFSYSEQDKTTKHLTEVPENYVSETPVFLVPLPKSFKLPIICTVCGLPATGARQFVAKYSIRDGSLTTTRLITYSIDEPLCKIHSRENESEKVAKTSLDVRSKKPDGTAPYQVPGLEVSSYRFYRAYLEMNSINDHCAPEMKP